MYVDAIEAMNNYFEGDMYIVCIVQVLCMNCTCTIMIEYYEY